MYMLDIDDEDTDVFCWFGLEDGKEYRYPGLHRIESHSSSVT